MKRFHEARVWHTVANTFSQFIKDFGSKKYECPSEWWSGGSASPSCKKTLRQSVECTIWEEVKMFWGLPLKMGQKWVWALTQWAVNEECRMRGELSRWDDCYAMLGSENLNHQETEEGMRQDHIVAIKLRTRNMRPGTWSKQGSEWHTSHFSNPAKPQAPKSSKLPWPSTETWGKHLLMTKAPSDRTTSGTTKM